MKSEKLLNAIGEIDEEKIIAARMHEKPCRNVRLKMTKICACAAVLLIIIVTLSIYNKDNDVVYAAKYDAGKMLEFNIDDKLNIDDAIVNINGNRKIRVAIDVRYLLESYPELESDIVGYEGITYEDLNKYMDEMDKKADDENYEITDKRLNEDSYFEVSSNLQKQALENEKSFLKKIGAYDITDDSGTTIICTIRKNDIDKLAKGKCNYVVVMCTKYDKEVTDMSIESYYCEYHNPEYVGISVLSSVYVYDENIKHGRLIINKKHFEISFESEGCVSIDNWSYEKIDDEKEIYEMLSTKINAGRNETELDKLIYSSKVAYKIFDESGNQQATVYISNIGIYVDLELGGVYKFKYR